MDKADQLRKQWAGWLTEGPRAVVIRYFSGRRGRVFELDGDGSLQVRCYGGPLQSFGQVTNREAQSLEVWRSVISPDLYTRLRGALVEAGFPAARERFNMVPDERPSSIVVKRGTGYEREMTMVSRLLRAHPLLHGCLDDVEAAGLQLTEARPPDGTVPNPELELWTEQARLAGAPRPPRPPGPGK